MEIEKIEDALKSLREDKRKFVQTVDLIVNLQNIDVRKESINTFIQIPNPSEKKIAAFMTKKSSLVDTITEADFSKYKEPKDIKKLAKKYDFFIASGPMMGKVASNFGKVFGPMNKMPSPQAGIVAQENDENITKVLNKLKKSIRVRMKEKSIKFAVGKEDLSDEQLKENIESALGSLKKALPKGNENVREVLIKLTMGKPRRIE